MNSSRIETAAIYCPLWHNYDHASSWKGEGWCEWELLKSAKPRFEGHYQPLKPEWGCFDESDPVWAAKEIDLAADHNIDVFIFDWYWYSGVRIMEEALEQGFLKAPNRERMKFALMWANHDWSDYFPAPFGKPWNSWLPMRHSLIDLERVIEYSIEYYFREPNYWTVGGKLFYSIFQPCLLMDMLGGPAELRKALKTIDQRLDRAKLPPIHWNGMVWSPDRSEQLAEAGFMSITSYNMTPGVRAAEGGQVDYAEIVKEHGELWQQMNAMEIPYAPVVTMGWDVTPRCETDIPWPFPASPASGNIEYPYGPVVVGNDPAPFEELCRQARAFAETAQPEPYAVFINAWNEWTEGAFLLPEARHGTAYLEGIKRVFV